MENEFNTLKVINYPDGRLDALNTAKYTGLSEKTLAMMRCKGTGPKFVKRGRIFYFLEDIDAWINEKGRSKTTSQSKMLRGEKCE